MATATKKRKPAAHSRKAKPPAESKPPVRIEPMPFDREEALKGFDDCDFHEQSCELYVIYIERHKGPRSGYVSAWYVIAGPRAPRMFTKAQADDYLRVFNSGAGDHATAVALRVHCFTFSTPRDSAKEAVEDSASRELNRCR